MHGQVDLTERAAPAPVDGPGRRSAVVAGPARLALLVVALLAAFVGGAVLLPPDRAARTAAQDASAQPPAAPPVAPSIQPPPAPTLSPAGTGVLRSRETRRPAKSPAARVPTKKKAASPTRTAGRPSSSRAAATADKPAKGVTALENQVTTLVNEARAEAGCGRVATDERLRKAARGHSQDMATKNYFSHDGQDGSSPWDRAKRAGYPNPIGENIAKGQRTPSDVMDGWMNSDGHRRNILNCDAKEIGVGLAYDGSSPVWTQLFGAG